MINAQMEIILTVCLTAIACAIPGVFLIFRKMSAYSCDINHSVLLGIVAAFFFVQWIDSPAIVFSAGIVAIVAVLFVEKINKTRLAKKDAIAGIVHPFMLSAAVIIISMFASRVSIDIDAALLGELAFTPLNRLQIMGYNLGPMALWQIGGLALLNIIFTFIFYKELKLSIFDSGFATTAGFAPKWIIYGLMVMVSFTSVAAFEVAGSIMTAGFIIGPAVIASYFTKRFRNLFFIAPAVGVISCLLGYKSAYLFGISIAGMIMTVMGAIFFLTFLFVPGMGVVAKTINKIKLKMEFSINILLVHLWQHEILGDSARKNSVDSVSVYLNWKSDFTESIIKQSMNEQLLGLNTEGVLFLLPNGKIRAQNILER
ncbi:MAG: metal ABC transporter permease [Deferribacteraceae bacterium]|jgi:manganese/zinc/iron transport system permease protein|nr:metal ABC transporter permease [Deferribacteraceae bacterium]